MKVKGNWEDVEERNMEEFLDVLDEMEKVGLQEMDNQWEDSKC